MGHDSNDNIYVHRKHMVCTTKKRGAVTQSIWILETELGKKPNSVVWFLPKIYFHIY